MGRFYRFRSRSIFCRADALPNLLVTSIAIHPCDPEILFASTSINVLGSRDGGDSWDLFPQRRKTQKIQGLSLRS